MQIETRTQQRFDAYVETTQQRILDQLIRYEDALWAGVANIRSQDGDMSYEEWTHFAQALKIEQKYPGTNGIGVIHYHTPETIAAYIAEQRIARPDFTVGPTHVNPFYMPITVITPERGNEQAVGLDVAHEAGRLSAAFASRDSGTAQITAPISLVQASQSTPGFLFYAPFYSPGTLESVSARQMGFQGAVYAPIIVEKLMDGLLANNLRQVSFSLKDAGTLIYNEHTPENAAVDPHPMHQTKIPLNLYGRTWVLDIRSDLAFRASNTYAQPTFILIAGLIVEALIIALLVLMSRANFHALSYADRVTAKLRVQSDELENTNKILHLKNNELEQFSYVASHDLKTPIRGIGGLVEIIEEDLEDYFASPDANTDVQKNLAHIQDRVTRMMALTRGILEFSKVDQTGADAHPVLMQNVADALVSDFGLDPHQLILSGDVSTIECDTYNFRRILENLVGNAITYKEDDISTLQMSLSVTAHGDFCKVCLADNGPGIDPAYHQKVFEVFQTLRLRDAAESTGIGLAIVKKAVERHGGQVTLTSKIGAGAKFTFDWPISAQNALPSNMQDAA